MPDDADSFSSADSSEANAAGSDGLPQVAPDDFEQEHAEQIDNIVPTRGRDLVPVVALGGSAGSIPVLRTFFENTPAATGLAYVVILHLAPEHESTLPALLQRYTAMPVRAAEEAAKVEANTVYVIPPGKYLTAANGHLRLTAFQAERGKRVAVDLFFRSLADTHGPRAAAVVLSGADGDGAVGLKRIKERGGLTIAQDPQEAEHPGMPKSAIATGMVDWILPAAEMPRRIAAYHVREERLELPPEDGPQPAVPAEPAPDQSEALLREVLALLRTRTGRDFSYYKRATIVRRISRRMLVSGVENLADYLAHLRMHPGETGALLHDLLISVTNFFRDRAAFEAAERHIPELFRNKLAGAPVRVWCAACATGEEVYSMAMLLLEQTRRMDTPPPVQIFGCDLDEEAIQVARTGFYPLTIEADVSEERLRRFFVKETNGYRVRREVREMVLFAAHDLLKDAPFSRMDLISCRNLLIYLNRDAQARALDIFHFALNPQALLFLGTSESVEEGSALFAPVDKKHRLYRHLPVPRLGLMLPAGAGAIQRVLQQHERLKTAAPGMPGPAFLFAPGAPAAPSPITPEFGMANELHFQLLGRFGPPSIVVNTDHNIVHLSDNAHRFLRLPEGEPTHHLPRLVPPALRLDLRAALFRAGETGEPVVIPRRRVEMPGGTKVVDIRVHPAGESAPGFLLVLFEEHQADESIMPIPPDSSTEAVVQQLERELARVNANLRDTVEQFEATTEEQKASNEELQAINEELRSAGEELETSREELQSVNEELSTVNHELKSRVEELNQSNSDLHNLMNATQIATVFLDRELRIMRFTPPAAPLFHLIPGDIGRPIAHLKQRLDYPELTADAEQVLRTLVPVERELREDGHWFLARVLPYRTVEDRIVGVVLTFVDITERRNAETALRASEEKYRLLFESIDEGFYFAEAIFDADGKCVDIFYHDENPAAIRMIGQSAKGRRLSELGPYEEYWREIFGKTARTGEPQHAEQYAAPDDIWYEFDCFKPPQAGENQFVIIFRDVTKRRQAFEALQVEKQRLQTILETSPSAVVVVDGPDGRFSFMNQRALTLYGMDYTGMDLSSNVSQIRASRPDGRVCGVEEVPASRALQHGEVVRNEKWIIHRADGVPIPVVASAAPIRNAEGDIVSAIVMFEDNTERERAEQALRESEARYHALFAASPVPFMVLAPNPPDFTITAANDAYLAATLTTREGLIGRRLFDVFTDDPNRPGDHGSDALAISLDRVLTTRQTDAMPRTRYDIVTKPGGGFEPHWWLAINAPMLDASGKISAIIHQVHRVTELHLAEEAEREAEAALRDKESRLRIASEAAELGVFEWNPSQDEVLWENDRMFEIFGRTREQGPLTATMFMADVVHPRDLDRFKTALSESLTSGRLHYTGRFHRSDGALRWIMFTGKMEYAADGKPLRMPGVAADVTERKRAEASEELRRIALESGRMGTWQLDCRNLLVCADAQFLAMWGLNASGESVSLAAFTDLMTPEDTAYWETLAAGEHSPGESSSGDIRIRSGPAAGRTIFYRASFSREMPWILNGISFDFTDQRQAEEALRASEERLQALVTNLPGGAAFIVDRDRRYLLAGGEALALAGFKPEDFIGCTVEQVLGPDLASSYEPQWQRAFAGETFSYEHESHGHTYATRGVPLRDAGGGVVAALAVSYDITERKCAEQALEENQRQLWEALIETKRARDEMQAASKAKDQFLAMLSHELRTPLTPVMMGTHILERQPGLPDIAREAISMMQRNLKIEAQFIDDLLDVTRIGSGKFEIAHQPLDVHEAVRRAIEVTEDDLHAKNLRLQVSLDAETHGLRGDSARLQQAFWNLLKNAAKFTPEGGEIRVRSWNEGSAWFLSIVDAGIGIETEALGKIFNAFTQAGIEITRAFGGLGLGLAIAKAAIEAHGGIIEVSSDGTGKGATFVIRLPVDPADAEMPAIHQEPP